jgi:ABC-2 type transport system ATP-binding protein
VLEAVHLAKRYGPTVAVDDVSFSISPGEVFGLLGTNGAGKSTTVKMLAGLIRPDSGHALVGGHDVVSEPSAAKAALGYLPETVTLYDRLTLREHLEFVGALNGMQGAALSTRAAELAVRVHLEDVLDSEMGTYSKGMLQRAALAAATIHSPRALVLDEPGSGLDPRFVRELKTWLRELSRSSAVLVCTHITGFASEVCDRLAIIHKGRLLAQGSLRELLDRASTDDLEEAFVRIIGG